MGATITKRLALFSLILVASMLLVLNVGGSTPSAEAYSGTLNSSVSISTSGNQVVVNTILANNTNGYLEMGTPTYGYYVRKVVGSNITTSFDHFTYTILDQNGNPTSGGYYYVDHGTDQYGYYDQFHFAHPVDAVTQLPSGYTIKTTIYYTLGTGHGQIQYAGGENSYIYYQSNVGTPIYNVVYSNTINV
jgi:hypothetical protein